MQCKTSLSVTKFHSVNDVWVYVLYAARRFQDSPVGIISGSAVAVVLCMLIVIIMVIIFLRRSVHNSLTVLPSALL